MKVAVEGCCHGELDAIYAHIERLEAKHGYQVELLLICGDFQAIRNHQDLQCMAVPAKYRQLGEFHKYYTEEKVAPILTIVIGGNHEASNYLWELYHGGWLAPNIYFLGHAGCVQVDGIRIAGASGIFKKHDFPLGSWEKVPYDHGSMRSVYHIREYSVRRLSLLSSLQVFLSHDWPQSIEHHGDTAGLIRRKPFFREDIRFGRLGSPPLMGLLRTLRPDWWFAAHLHVRFDATVVHSGPEQPIVDAPSRSLTAITAVQNPDEIAIYIDDELENETPGGGGQKNARPEAGEVDGRNKVVPPPAVASTSCGNPDEIILDDEEAEVVAPPSAPARPKATQFIALDKCLPKREFLEVVDIDATLKLEEGSSSLVSGQRRRPTLSFDPEWLAITRAFHPYLSTTRHQLPFPDEGQARQMVEDELNWVKTNLLDDHGDGVVGTTEPDNTAQSLLRIEDYQRFAQTAPGPGTEGDRKNQQPPWYTNPQTEAFCDMLQLENKINPPPRG